MNILIILSIQICDNSKSQFPIFILCCFIFFCWWKIVFPKIIGWFTQVLSHPLCLIVILWSPVPIVASPICSLIDWAEIPVSLVNGFSRSSYGWIHNSPLVAEPPQGVSPIRCECHYTVQWFHLLARVKSQTPTTKTCFRCMLPLIPVSLIVKVREQFLLFW